MQTLKTMMNSVRVLLGLGAMLLVVTPTWATLYVLDPVPADSTGSGGRYKSSVKLYGQTTTNAAIIGETGAWGAYDAGTVFMPETLALSYPGNVILTATGGSFSIRTNGVSQVDGHLQSRPITGLPTSGTVYLSLLTRIDSSGINYLTNGMSMGMGLSTNSASTKLTFGALPPNGVYLGFCSNTIAGPGRALMLNVLGQNYCLVSNPAVNTTFFCLAKIDIGAGEGGADVVSAVVNPSAMPATQAGYTVTVTNWVLNGGSFTHLSLGGAIRTNDKRIQFDEIRVASTLSEVAPIYFDRPEFGIAPTVTCGADNIFRFSSTLTNVTADTQLFACYGTTSGSTSPSSWEYSKLVSAPPTVNVASTTTLDAFVTNTCYTFAALATNANFSVLKTGTTFMTGEVWLTPGSNALESSSVPGSVIVHRPASATQADLVVNYTVSGSATPDVNYFTNNLVGSVTIPAGQETASIAVLPMVSPSSSSPSVSITLAEGRYYIGAANSASITIENYDYPADRNIWVATSASRASDYRNWSQGRIPNATDSIQLDSSSTNSLSWDAGVNGLTDTVASWTQTTNYTGVVTFPINFTNVVGAVFTNFTVTGDVVLVNGMWTHTAHTNTTTAMKKDYYRLKVTVGGNLTVASAASISATGRGSFDSYNGSGGAYGGANNYGASTVYGNPYEPENVGSSAKADDGKMGYAGGALWLEVAGNAVVAGTISANGQSVNGQWADVYSGSGGSIYLKASSLSGAGSIYANGTGSGGSKSKNCSSGGRISILLTGSEMSFPVSKIKATGESEYGNVAGAGTLVVRTPATPNGTLYVVNATSLYGQYAYRPMLSQLTPIPSNQVWTFDAVVTGDNGILSIPTGTTLNLARGFESVSSSSTERENGILIDGGNLTYPPQGTHTISNYWILQANTPYTLTGNLVVTNAAAVGSLRIYNTSTSTCAKCTFTVTGDMTVASNGYLYAVNSGYATSGSTSPMVSSGYGSHGGQNGQYTTNTTYDSILNPRHGGTFGGTAESLPQGGGVMNLTVGGTLRIDGTATAGLSDSSRGRPGGAGTFNLTAARLEGTGSINANGSIRNVKDGTYYGASGGGRISVRLTDPAATFSEYWKSAINAKGGYTSLSTLLATNSSSAGTVYLQSGSEAEAHGTVVVRNDNNVLNNLAFTPIPSRIQGGENDVFSKVSFTVEDCARIKLFETLQIASLSLEANTVIDCNGYVLTVRRMTAGGTPIARGTYVSGSSLFTSGYVRDTSAGLTGALIVIGEPSLISIR